MSGTVLQHRGFALAIAAGMGAWALPAAALPASWEQENIMKHIKSGSQAPVQGPAEWFTGTAWITPLQMAPDEPSRVTAALVTFEPGARTNWHEHPAGQLLIVSEGVGWTQVEGEEKVEFQAGDVMLCPKDRKHWHGATPEARMSHYAIQEQVDGSNVTWYGPVSDKEYLGTE